MKAWIVAAALSLAAWSTVSPADSSAKDTADEAVHDSPASASAYAHRGDARQRLGDFDGAIADYTKALSLGPPDADVLYSRGVAMIATQDFQGAIADLTLALSIDPHHAKALFTRGTARFHAGDPDRAHDDWIRAVELEPDPEERATMVAAIRASARAAPDAEDVPAMAEPAAPLRVEATPAPVPAVAVSPAQSGYAPGTTTPPAPMGYDSARAAAPPPTPPAAESTPPAAAATAPPAPQVAAAPSAAAAGSSPASPSPVPEVAPSVPAPDAATSPPSASAPSPAPSQEVASIPAAPAPAPVPLDSRALAARGLEKELHGDHEGALADLRAALVIEPDPERQRGIRNLLQLLDARQ